MSLSEMSLLMPSRWPQPAAAPPSCPFNREEYAAGLRHLGQPDLRPGAPGAMLRRQIDSSTRFDGLGPWPYLWIDDDQQLSDLRGVFRDLVTLTIVTQPGYRPGSSIEDTVFFKEHYVFDPGRQFPEMSKKTRKQVRRGLETYEFDVSTDIKQRLEVAALYRDLKHRRRLAGGFFDFPRSHFEILAGLPEALFVRVRQADRVDAVACGVVFGDWIQLLHIAISDTGLRGSASYALMFGLLDYAKTHGRTLCLGGIPRDGNEGLIRFKVRWSNRRAPVFLLRIINDRSTYAELSAGLTRSDYFPGYRQPM